MSTTRGEAIQKCIAGFGKVPEASQVFVSCHVAGFGAGWDARAALEPPHEELIRRARDAVDELEIEDELAEGFRSRNGDLSLRDAVDVLNAMIATLESPHAAAVSESEREALVETIREPLRWHDDDPPQSIADAVIAAGYRREVKP